MKEGEWYRSRGNTQCMSTVLNMTSFRLVEQEEQKRWIADS
jgi:hypothetical protein